MKSSEVRAGRGFTSKASLVATGRCQWKGYRDRCVGDMKMQTVLMQGSTKSNAIGKDLELESCVGELLVWSSMFSLHFCVDQNNEKSR